MRQRPRDFFGPDDYVIGDPRDQEARIREEQNRWDRDHARLPLWRRVFG